jgi:hypothetical protein
VSRVQSKCHSRRNIAKYERSLEIDDQLLQDLLFAAQVLSEYVGGISIS